MSHPPTATSAPKSSSSSSQPKQDRRRRNYFTPSIVTAEPQGDLFPVLPFGLNFRRLVEEQEEHDPYYEYFEDKDQEDPVAERCDTWKHQVDANKLFEDPTVFGLLKEWYEQRLDSCKETQDPTLRPTWASVHGQADEIDHGILSEMYAREPPRLGVLTSDDRLGRLLSSSARGRRRVPFSEKKRRRAPAPAAARGHTEKTGCRTETSEDKLEDGEEEEIQTTNKRRKTVQPVMTDSNVDMDDMDVDLDMDINNADRVAGRVSTDEAMATTSTNDDIVRVDPMKPTRLDGIIDLTSDHHEEEQPAPNTDIPATVGSSASSNPSPNPNIHVGQGENEIENIEPNDVDIEDEPIDQGLPRIHTGGKGRIPVTSLERRFHEYSMKIEDSRLRALSDESRLQVPFSLRPPLNFLGPKPPHYSIPYKPVVDQDIVVSVAFYDSHRPSERVQEFLFLGSQPLTAMRDAFFCPSDFPTREGDDPPDDLSFRNTEKKKISNSYMLIEGVFYNDSPLLRTKIDKRDELNEDERKRLNRLAEQCKERYQECLRTKNQVRRRKKGRGTLAQTEQQRKKRGAAGGSDKGDKESDLDYDDSDLRAQMQPNTYRDPSLEDIRVENEEKLIEVSLDYSQTILDWIDADPKRKEMPGYKQLQKKHMHETLIQDLKIRLNYPYLFVHQGNCEHIIMFHDLRLFSHQHDDLNRNNYPVQTFQGRKLKQRCQMCNAGIASFVTVNDRLAGRSPCYFCEDCYVAFHYDVEGDILYDDFQVFSCNT